MFLSPLALVLLQAAASDTPAPVSAWSSSGELGLEGRVFRGDGDPVTNDQALGMVGRLELRHQRPVFEAKARGFGRLDDFDRERSRLIAEEAWLQVQSERLRLRVGVDILDWSATEVFHPADVINARNLDSDLENFEKTARCSIPSSATCWSVTASPATTKRTTSSSSSPSSTSSPRESTLVNLAFQRRLGESWTGKLGLRVFQAPAASPLESRGISLVRDGDRVRVSLTRHF